MSHPNLSLTPGLMRLFSIAIPCAAMLAGVAAAQQDVEIQWHNVRRVNRSNASLQAVVTPLMSRSSPLHDKVWQALKDLHAQHVRYVPWLPYPKLAVAELEPPENGKTSWDFSLIDPFTIDFLEATKGHSVMLNFSTIPQWMFKTPQPVSYPADPNHAVWDYTQGTELRDPSDNTHNQPAAISIAGSAGGMQETVDQTTGFNPPAARQLDSDKSELAGLAVQVITLP